MFIRCLKFLQLVLVDLIVHDRAALELSDHFGLVILEVDQEPYDATDLQEHEHHSHSQDVLRGGDDFEEGVVAECGQQYGSDLHGHHVFLQFAFGFELPQVHECDLVLLEVEPEEEEQESEEGDQGDHH